MKSKHILVAVTTLSCLVPAAGWADQIITTNTTVNGGTLVVDPAGALIVNDASDPTLSLSGSATTSGVQAVVISNTTQGSLSVTGGAVLSNPGDGSQLTTLGGTDVLHGETYLGLNVGSSGTMNVSGAGSRSTNGSSVVVGHDGTGTLNIQSGGVISDTEGEIGYNAGSTGTTTVTGTGSQWSNSSSVLVGVRGSGQLNVQNGGVVSGTDTYLGLLPGSSGTAMVDGAGSRWNSTSLDIGGGGHSGGNGSLTISNSGAVNVVGQTKLWNSGGLNLNGGSLTTGSFDNSVAGNHSLHFASGMLTVNNGPYIQSSGPLLVDGTLPTFALSGSNTTTVGIQDVVVGDLAQGALSVTGRAVLANGGNAALGYSSTSNGTVTVRGTGSQWNSAGFLLVGNQGVGTLVVQDGGKVSDTSANMAVGLESVATATVTGAGSQWNSTSLSVGGSGSDTLPSGTASLTVSNSGTVNVTGAMAILPGSTAAAGSGGTINAGSINILAGTLNIEGGATTSPISMNGGTVHLSGGDLTSNISIGDSIRVNTPNTLVGANATGPAYFQGKVVLHSDVTLSAEAGSLVTFGGVISGSGGVTIGGTGTVALGNIDNYVGPTTVVPGSHLFLAGATVTSSVTVADGAVLSGAGSLGAIGGGGLVAPSNYETLAAGSVDPSSAGATSFAFALATPAIYPDPVAVLRLTGTTPFNRAASPATDNPLTSLNNVDIYLPALSSLAAGEKFDGGFFADQRVPRGSLSLESDVAHASYHFYTLDPDQSGANGIRFNGQYYLAATGLKMVIGAENRVKDFGHGDVFGSIETFTVQAVPEPSSWALCVCGASALLATRLRRSRKSL